jgi:hypothetical protein
MGHFYNPRATTGSRDDLVKNLEIAIVSRDKN